MEKTTKEVLHTKDGQELQSLRNALSSLNLTGYEIFQSQTSKYQYCLIDDKANYLTGFWNYTNLNHFIMGYGKAVNERQKLLDSNREMKKVLEEFMNIVSGISSVPKGSKLTVTIPASLFESASKSLNNAKNNKP